MILSFFSQTEYTTGIDYSHHPDCLHTEDIPFSPDSQVARLVEGEDGKYIVQVTDIVAEKPVETPTEKHARITQKVLTGSFTKEDLEGETLTSDEKRKIINTLVYGDELSETYWLKKEIRLSSKSSTLYTKPGTMFSASEKADCLKIQEQIKRIDELKTLLS